FIQEIKKLRPDIIIIVAYGQILNKEFLSIPKLGCINVHASLLPKFRGSAPIQWAILEGESKTGVTVQKVSEKLDAGDIIAQKETEIAPFDDFLSLYKRLADLGAGVLKESIFLIKNKSVKPMPQDEKLAAYVRKITKEDGLIDWNESALKIHNKVRALNPWPGTYTFLSGLMIKIIKTEFSKEDVIPNKAFVIPSGSEESVVGATGRSPLWGKISPFGRNDSSCAVEMTESNAGDFRMDPGEIIVVDKEKIAVHCADGMIYIKEIQPEAKRIMTAGEFISGYRLKPGMRFDKK
ncbi:MAG: methionyl-tRNA formyltransferase, partial [bacterium]